MRSSFNAGGWRCRHFGCPFSSRCWLGSLFWLGVLQLVGASYRVVDLEAEDLLWDAPRQRLYASVPSSDAFRSNSVSAIDPVSGSVVFSIPVGPVIRSSTTVPYRSGKLALSDDGRFLYVAVSNALAVQRIDLATQTPGPVFAVGSTTSGTALSVADMVVLTGSATSVAIARADVSRARGVAIYDNGVRREKTTPELTLDSIDVLELSGQRSVLLGFNNRSSDFDFTRIAVDASGATVLDATPGLLSGFYADITFQNGFVFGSFGGLVDPLVPARLGEFAVETFGACCMYVAPDPEIERVFFLSRIGTKAHLQGHDLRTFLPLKSEEIPGDGGTTKNLVRWGTNGLAFTSTAGKIYLVQSPLLFPPGPPAALRVFQSNAPTIPQVGVDLTITVTVTNAGPHEASDLTFTDTLPAGVSFVSATVSQGTWSRDETLLRGRFGILPAGSGATLTLVVRPEHVGWITNRVVAIANEADADLTDNISTSQSYVRLPSNPLPVATITMPTLDLAYAPNTRLLYMSVPAPVGGPGGSVVPLNPETGELGPPLLAGEDPRQLILSADRQYLYVATQNNQRIRRIDLPAGTAGPDFALGTAGTAMTLEDMEALAGQPASLVVVQTPNGFDAEVAVYDSGVARPDVAAVKADAHREILELADHSSMAFVQNFGAGGLWSYTIEPSGARFLKSDDSLTPLFTPLELEWCEDALYTSTGLVVEPAHSVILGQIPSITAPSLVTFDPAVRRLYYLTADGTSGVLRAIDPSTWTVLDSMSMNNLAGVPTDLIRWGEDGLAFRTSGDQVFLLRGSIVPSAPPADLTISSQPSTNVVSAGAEFRYTIAITNLGPGMANNVIALHVLPESVTYESGTASSGVPIVSNNTVRCNFGSLAQGASASLVITARPPHGGPVTSVSSVIADSRDPDLANNTARTTIQATLLLGPGQQGQFALAAYDLAHDRLTDRLYVSGPGQTVSVVNPAAGLVVASWPVSGSPGFVRLSDDGSFLYCSLNEGLGLVRLDTRNGLPERQWSFDVGAVDLEPLPGASGSFVVSRGPGQVEVYDDDVPRPRSLVDSVGARDLEFGDSAGAVYTVGRAPTGGSLYRVLTISETGIAGDFAGLNVHYSLGKLTWNGEVLYAGTGEILEPSTGTVLGRFPDVGQDSIALAEATRQRVYFLNRSDTTWRVQSYDPSTQVRLASLAVPNVSGVPTALVRWGEDGLAFRTSSNQVFLLRTALVPGAASADLGVSQTASPVPVLLGSSVTYQIEITNAGPNSASEVVLADRWATDALFVAATVSQGSVVQTPGQLTWSVNTIAPGSTAQLQLKLRSMVGGQILNTAAISSPHRDPQLNNNTSALVASIRLDLQPNQYAPLSTPVLDLAFDRASGLLYGTTSRVPGTHSNGVFALDPATGLVGPPIFVGPGLSKIAITDDGSRLYVLTEDGARFVRLALPGGAVELEKPFGSSPDGPDRSEFILAVPGQPGSLVAVVQRAGVLLGNPMLTVFDGAGARPDRVETREAVFYAANQLLGFDDMVVPSATIRIALGASGFVAEPRHPDLVDGDMAASGGLVYTSNGSVIDPATMTRIQSFGVWGPVAVDAALNRVAFVTGTSNPWTLREFDTGNSREWGSMTLSNLLGHPVQLVRCGADRLAFRTSSNQLFIARTVLGQGDLAVAYRSWPTQALAGQPIQFSLSVSNAGNSLDPSVVVTNTIPAQTSLLGVQASQGVHQVTDSQAVFVLGSLPAGASAWLAITLLPTNAIDLALTNTVVVTGALTDVWPADNTVTACLASFADTDRDGLPDDWEKAHSLDHLSALDALWDADCDGLNNLEEYLAGKDPLAFDGPRLGQARVSPLGDFECTLHAVVGRVYVLQVSTNLVQWSDMTTITVTNCPSFVQDPSPWPAPLRFYRLVAP